MLVVNLKHGVLISAQRALEKCIPVYTNWRLNERFYGKLQGMNKDEAKNLEPGRSILEA